MMAHNNDDDKMSKEKKEECFDQYAIRILTFFFSLNLQHKYFLIN